METFLDILKYILPSFLVFLMAFVMLKKMHKNEQERRLFELKKNDNKLLLQVKLRAYERLILFLERTQPTSILMRQDLPTMSCLQLQTQLVEQIRSEYEHNIAQQLYVSSEAWSLICRAKESSLKLVHLSATQVNAVDKALKMAEKMIEISESLSENATQTAIDFLKKEIKTIF